MRLFQLLLLSVLMSSCGDSGETFLTLSPRDSWDGHFDADKIQDASDANCSFTNTRQVDIGGNLLDVWDLSYTSWEYINGEGLRDITIRGFAAKPSNQSANLPALVHAHGLGGNAVETDAANIAAALNAFVVVYSGPGSGNPAVPASQSEGLPSTHNNGYRLFDTLENAKGTWFWAHAIAAMRGVTCLETRAEVDVTRMGMTGGSAGGIATLISASVDDRILAAVAMSSSLSFDKAVLSPNAWQHMLLQNAGLTTASTEWTNLVSAFLSSSLLPGVSSSVLMLNGTTDEFFPLQAHMDTYSAIPGTDKRLSFIANYDHGCTAVNGISGVDTAEAINARAAIRIIGGQIAWFGHWFANNSDFVTLPETPGLSMTEAGAQTFIQAIVDTSASTLGMDEVRLWWSEDQGLSFNSQLLADSDAGNFSTTLAVERQNIDVALVDVLYSTSAVVNPIRFSVSSAPLMGSNFTQVLRNFGTCVA